MNTCCDLQFLGKFCTEDGTTVIGYVHLVDGVPVFQYFNVSDGLPYLGIVYTDACSDFYTSFIPSELPQGLSGNGAMSVTAYLTNWQTAGADTATLADGTKIGQLKKIIDTGGGGGAVLTPDSLEDGTTITFNAAGEIAVLMWIGTGWKVIELSCTVTPSTIPVLA